MCGIVGFWCPAGGADLLDTVESMAGTMAHRGPDDSGTWIDKSSGLALAHRRLSILDLTRTGHQPMSSPSDRWVIVFNGEIYNHHDLRKSLAGVAWRGHSDTETILAAIDAWGIEATLKKLTGMFAFALWDRADKSLILARDRLGEKPLYYGWIGNTFLFGSELKALRAHPGWKDEIDREALAGYMRYGYVPLPHSIYQGVVKLLPGTWLTLPMGASAAVSPAPTYYWRASDVALAPVCNDMSDATAIAELDAQLRRAIGGQMLADVPLGAFLSGGVDSSTIVALMQAQATRPVRTFTIGFDESGYDEACYAKTVAAHLGTEHTELYLSPQDAQDVIPRLPLIYDEPFGDSSQIPTHLIATMARQHVTVALSGDGGDELFGGYNRYFWGRSIWRQIQWAPRPLRTAISCTLKTLSPARWNQLANMLPGPFRLKAFGDKIHKLASVIDVADSAELHRRLVTQHRECDSIVQNAREPAIWAENEAARVGYKELYKHMMFHDLVGYLTDDILVKVDRAAMAVSLETRIPLLDHGIVEFALRLPIQMKIRNGQGKWLLRQVLYQYVPREMIERPKQGFSVPLDSWLRGSLRDWAEALLDESRIKREGFLNAGLIGMKWHEHLSGQRNWQHWLWNVLMFQAWLEHQHA